MINITEKNINAFLHYGWLPRTDIDPPFPEDWIPTTTSSKKPCLKTGGEILRQAVLKSVEGHKKVIVPLSGGLDSRAILAILREQNFDILAVTVGTPGTYDYDYGKMIAQKANVEHVGIDITKTDISTPELVNTARMTGDWTNIIEVYFNLLINQRYGDFPVASGFLGDFLGGAYRGRDYGNWNETKKVFAEHNNNTWNNLTDKQFDPTEVIDIEVNNNVLSPYEQLVFKTRHTCSLRPTAFTDNFNYVLPFKDKDWVQFILSHRSDDFKNSNLYHQILLDNWPELFKLPTKNFKGANLESSTATKKLHKFKNRVRNKIGRTFPHLSESLIGIDPMVNYTNFHTQIEKNENMRSVIIKNIKDLEKRNVTTWLNWQEINKDLEKKLNFKEGLKLMALANLEINLKSSQN